MLARLRGFLFEPRAAWARVAATPQSAASMLAGWILPLALLPFAATLLRFLIFSAIFGTATGFAAAPYILADAAGQYVFVVVWTLAVALATDRLAPRFGAARAFGRACAAVGYSLTPAFLFSLVGIVPWLGLLGLAGAVWAVALLRLGLPRVMGSPDERSTSYTAAVTAIAVLLALLAALVPSCAGTRAGDTPPLVGTLAPTDGAVSGRRAAGGGTRSPDERLEAEEKTGVGSLNLDGLTGKSIGELIEQYSDPAKRGEAERFAREAAASTARIPFKRAEPSVLGELLPPVACGQARLTLESNLSRLPIGEIAIAKAEFGPPGQVVLRMEIGDRSPLATGMVQIRKLMPERAQTTASGYQRFREEDGVFIDDRWDSRRKEARFVALIADRFAVSATASRVESPECAEAAVRAVDWSKLASMAAGGAR